MKVLVAGINSLIGQQRKERKKLGSTNDGLHSWTA